MKILSVETSCDETAVAIVEDGRAILANQILSQADMHALYGGVFPELASRAHVEAVGRLTKAALGEANLTSADIDAIAVTNQPGLIGALLVGLSFAKGLAYAWGVPLIPVHHIHGHVAANYLAYPDLTPPFLCMVASGGHTQFWDVRDFTDLHLLGQTRDDAAGECFDKVARVLGLPYPGGKPLDDLAQEAKPGQDMDYPLPRSKFDDHPLDMSFSGLKTATLNIINQAKQKGETLDLPGLTASFNRAVSDAIVPRARLGLEQLGYSKIAIAGGVAANRRVRADMETMAQQVGATLYLPPMSLCGDNAAMIGAQGYFVYQSGVRGALGCNARATG